MHKLHGGAKPKEATLGNIMGICYPASSERVGGNGCSLRGRLSLPVDPGRLSFLTPRDSVYFDTRPKRFRRPGLEDGQGLEETAEG